MKHATDCKRILALVILIASGCGKNQTDNNNVSDPVSLSAPAETFPDPTPPSAESLGGPAAWSGRPGTEAWTSAVTSVVARNLASFEKARDKETFCPGYSGASRAQRETCWVRLVSAVAQYESGFNPGTMYKESNGVYSVGLLQLSSGECANAPSNAALKDPVQNLLCGTKKMADLIARYGYVTSPDNRHGAAAYWSTLRAPYVMAGAHRGKKNQIVRISAEFAAVTPVSAREEMVAEE